MIKWTYNAADYDPDRYKLIPAGKYRVRIEKAEEQESKSGYPMIKLTLKVSGYRSQLWHYVVFMQGSPERVQMTNDNLGRIYDSFGIEPGDLNLEHWEGKVGAAEIKHEADDKKEMRAKVNYFIQRKEQESLPDWAERPGGKINAEMLKPDEPIPF